MSSDRAGSGRFPRVLLSAPMRGFDDPSEAQEDPTRGRMRSHRKREARHLQEVLEAELDRIAAGPSRSSPEGEFIWVDEVDLGDKSGSTGARVLMSVPAWWVDEFPPGLEWRGSLTEALERLRRVANDAGIGVACATLWPDDPCARLWGELDRVGASAWRAELAGETEWVRAAGDETELGLRAQGNSSRAWSWRGPVTEALGRLAALPDGAGPAGVWAAFPDARRVVAPPTWVDVEVGDDDTKELRGLLERELWRIGVSEDQSEHGVHSALISASEEADPPEFRIREGWPLRAGYQATTEVWSGTSRELGRTLEGIPDDAGFGRFWLTFMAGDEPARSVFSELVRLDVWAFDYLNEGEEDVDAELDASGSELTLVGDTRFWTGPLADALKVAATLPDRAGHRRFWELFPDTTVEGGDAETDFDTDLDAAVKRFEGGDVTAAAGMLGVLYRRSSGVAERKQIDDVVDQMLHYLPRKEQKAFKSELALEAEGTSRVKRVPQRGDPHPSGDGDGRGKRSYWDQPTWRGTFLAGMGLGGAAEFLHAWQGWGIWPWLVAGAIFLYLVALTAELAGDE